MLKFYSENISKFIKLEKLILYLKITHLDLSTIYKNLARILNFESRLFELTLILEPVGDLEHRQVDLIRNVHNLFAQRVLCLVKVVAQRLGLFCAQRIALLIRKIVERLVHEQLLRWRWRRRQLLHAMLVMQPQVHDREAFL